MIEKIVYLQKDRILNKKMGEKSLISFLLLKLCIVDCVFHRSNSIVINVKKSKLLCCIKTVSSTQNII